MTSRFRVRAIDAMVVAAIAAFVAYWLVNRPPQTGEGPSAFTQQVRLDPLYKTAVQADGRLRSFESHPKTYMGMVSGSRSIRGQSNGFTYLDLMLQPQGYADADLIYVKNNEIR